MRTLEIDDELEYKFNQLMRKLRDSRLPIEYFLRYRENLSDIQRSLYDLERIEHDLKEIFYGES